MAETTEVAATETPVETPAVAQEAAEVETVSSEGNNIKVFVGNIDYKVTDEQLKEFFKDLKL